MILQLKQQFVTKKPADNFEFIISCSRGEIMFQGLWFLKNQTQILLVPWRSYYTSNIVVHPIQITWQIKEINFDYTFASQGVYKLRATFSDTRSKEEVGCFEANWTISKVHRKQESQRLLFYRTKRWAAGPWWNCFRFSNLMMCCSFRAWWNIMLWLFLWYVDKHAGGPRVVTKIKRFFVLTQWPEFMGNSRVNTIILQN